ncbi:galactose-specific lectin nattectin-like, partial [Lineus longissimus]|uniref:galactose-specific lectin nattectin-like n=1 Tax=Lineus longissimus TaxID=88925 RepID=UPI00315DA42D
MTSSDISLLLLTFAIGTARACQSGWVSTDQSCYLLSKTEATWEEARAACFQLDANLVVIDNPVEFAQLSAILNQRGDHAPRWLGGYFLPRLQPYWFWDDGSIIPRQQYWTRHKPPHHSTVQGRCVSLASRQDRRLDNDGCLVKKKYVCERNGHYQYLTWCNGDAAVKLTCPHNQVIKIVSWKVAPSKYHKSCKVYDQATAYHNKPTQGFRDVVALCNMKNSCTFKFWFVEM